MSGQRLRALAALTLQPARRCLLVLTAMLCPVFGCAEEPALALVTPDRASFEVEVYPVLLRDCGFHACHGSTDRFFQVFGPGRRRLNAITKPLDPPAPEEIAHAYDRARSMLDAQAIESSLLLRKPLAAEGGGTGHQGVDDLGRNVYQSTTEPGYEIIARWAHSIEGTSPAP